MLIQHEELVTNALHSPSTPSTLCEEEAQELREEEADEVGAGVTEPSIEMAEDLKEPGISGGGGVEDGDSGTEINTSGVVEDQHQQEESVEAESCIQEPALAEAVEIVASGSECRPEVQNSAGLSSSSSASNLANREIPQENIKHALHEIISEIDREMEADFSNEEVSFCFFPAANGQIHLLHSSATLFLVHKCCWMDYNAVRASSLTHAPHSRSLLTCTVLYLRMKFGVPIIVCVHRHDNCS